jgi:hypothetical protein
MLAGFGADRTFSPMALFSTFSIVSAERRLDPNDRPFLTRTGLRKQTAASGRCVAAAPVGRQDI